MSVASVFEHAERVVEDVTLLQDMAAGKLDERRVRQAAEVLLEHRRNELPSVSVAVAARLLDVSRTTVEAWRSSGVLTPAVKHRRHEVTVDSLVRLQALISELRRLGRMRQLRDYVWWSAQDSADYANGQLSEALRQLRQGACRAICSLRSRSGTGSAGTRRRRHAGVNPTVTTIPARLAAAQIAALQGKPKAALDLAVADIRRRGCAAAGVRLEVLTK